MYRLLFNLNTKENMAFHCTLSLSAGNLDNNNIWSPNQMLRTLEKGIWILALKTWIVFTSVIFFSRQILDMDLSSNHAPATEQGKEGLMLHQCYSNFWRGKKTVGKVNDNIQRNISCHFDSWTTLLLIHQQMWQIFQLPS